MSFSSIARNFSTPIFVRWEITSRERPCCSLATRSVSPMSISAPSSLHHVKTVEVRRKPAARIRIDRLLNARYGGTQGHRRGCNFSARVAVVTARPDIVLLGAEWPTRALLRAQLAEEGYNVLATDRWPIP